MLEFKSKITIEVDQGLFRVRMRVKGDREMLQVICLQNISICVVIYIILELHCIHYY